jgi:hypothetical protein
MLLDLRQYLGHLIPLWPWQEARSGQHGGDISLAHQDAAPAPAVIALKVPVGQMVRAMP